MQLLFVAELRHCQSWCGCLAREDRRPNKHKHEETARRWHWSVQFGEVIACAYVVSIETMPDSHSILPRVNNIMQNVSEIKEPAYLKGVINWFLQLQSGRLSLYCTFTVCSFYLYALFVRTCTTVYSAYYKYSGHKTIVAPFMAPALNHFAVNSGLSQPWALIRHCWAQFYSEGGVMKHWVGVVVLYIAACVGQLFNQSL